MTKTDRITFWLFVGCKLAAGTVFYILAIVQAWRG